MHLGINIETLREQQYSLKENIMQRMGDFAVLVT